MLFRPWPKYGAQINVHRPMGLFPSPVTFSTVLCLSTLGLLRFAKIPHHPLIGWNWFTVSVFYLLIWEMSWELELMITPSLVNRKQTSNKQTNKTNNTVSSFGTAANSFMISGGWSHRQSRERKGAPPLTREGESRGSWWCVSGKIFVIHSVRMGEAWLG